MGPCAPEAAKIVIGSVIDKYEVLQKLGEGATATVYRGRHLAIGNDVAIKVLHPHLSASPRYRERFNREARAVGRLSHQNIVSILDYSGKAAGDCYIVTELVDGVTLLGLLQEHGTLPSEIAAVVGMELCSALGFAHTAQVIHRDIKPENVMIRRDGKVKLMDFGVARVLDEGSITLDGSLLGSPAYMSPQQAQDQPLDGRSDLFSLGTVLFHAVTGHVPYSGGNTSVILKNIIDGNRPDVLELAPAASPGFAAVVDKLLQSRPEDRYLNAEETRLALLATLAEVELTLDHPSLQVANYLLNPEGCALQLRQHLEPVLLRKGKERLAAGDHLGALQLLNRLLALDENNAEVLELIQGLHQPAVREHAPRKWVALLACTLGLVGALGVWWLRASSPAELAAHPPAAVPEIAAVASLPSSAAPSPVAQPAPVTPSTPPGQPPRSIPLPLAPRRLSEPATAALTPVVAPPVVVAAPVDASLVVVSMASADVWLDGKPVGKTRTGPVADWVASSKSPLTIAPGHHSLTLKYRNAEDWVREFDATPGQQVRFTPSPKRLPVTFMINSAVPHECSYTVGGVRYGNSVRQLEVDEPDPNIQVIFTCGTKTQSVTPCRNAQCNGGNTVIVPESVNL